VELFIQENVDFVALIWR